MKRTRYIPKQTFAVGYVRVSTAMQADEGVSISAQKEKITCWANMNGITLIEIFEDNGISGKNTTARPGFQKAMEAALRHKAIMVCYSLSRLSRSMKDMIEIGSKLGQAGCDLVSLTEQIDTTTAAGKMIFNMLAVLGQFHVDLISEWTKMGLAKVKRDGRKTGGPTPFGYNVDEAGKLHPNLRERKVIGRIMKLHSTGMKYQTIGNQLNDQGIVTKTGRKWFSQTVKNVVLANTKTNKQ